MQVTTLDRRRTIALLGGGLAMAGVMPVALAAPRNTLFNVYRKGSLIGTHAIDFAGAGDRLQVTSRLDLAVKVAFITAYRYVQTGHDIWEDGVLVHTWIETDDDGAESLVVAEARGGKLAVTGPTGAYDTSLGAMTDLSFWNEGITRGQPVIDSQNGELIEIEVNAGTPERVAMPGRTIEAERFRMAGTRGRSGTVWYDADGNLVKAVVVTRGETLSYELAS